MVGISKVLIVANKRNNNNNPIKSKFIAVFSKPDSIHPVTLVSSFIKRNLPNFPLIT